MIAIDRVPLTASLRSIQTSLVVIPFKLSRVRRDKGMDIQEENNITRVTREETGRDGGRMAMDGGWGVNRAISTPFSDSPTDNTTRINKNKFNRHATQVSSS